LPPQRVRRLLAPLGTMVKAFVLCVWAT
jgi:hypothetical protein